MANLPPGANPADLEAAQKEASEMGNDPSIEMAWAIKAYGNAETHMNLLQSVEASTLAMCECDDAVLMKFHDSFPNFSVKSVTEEDLKSPSQKAKWREFSETFKNLIDDYNFGSLLRLESHGDYDQENTILVTKVQFLAIEIARNRQGHNSVHRKVDQTTNQMKSVSVGS